MAFQPFRSSHTLKAIKGSSFCFTVYSVRPPRPTPSALFCLSLQTLCSGLATVDLWPAGCSKILWTALLFLWKGPGMLLWIMGKTAGCRWCYGQNNLLTESILQILCLVMHSWFSSVYVSYVNWYGFYFMVLVCIFTQSTITQFLKSDTKACCLYRLQ